MLSIEPTIINENTPRVVQPPGIKTKLKEHQLAMIHEMRDLETPARKKLKLTNESSTEYSFKTKFGCICDKVGSGKSLTILGIIGHKTFLKIIKMCYTEF